MAGKAPKQCGSTVYSAMDHLTKNQLIDVVCVLISNQIPLSISGAAREDEAAGLLQPTIDLVCRDRKDNPINLLEKLQQARASQQLREKIARAAGRVAGRIA